MFRKKKNPRRTICSSIFLSKVQNLTVLSFIYMIRIRFFGPGECLETRVDRLVVELVSEEMRSEVDVPMQFMEVEVGKPDEVVLKADKRRRGEWWTENLGSNPRERRAQIRSSL